MQTLDGTGTIGTNDIMSTRIIGISRVANKTRLWLEWQPSIIDRLGVTRSLRNIDNTVFANIHKVDASKQGTSKALIFGLEFPEVKSIDAESALYDDIELYKSVVRAGTTYTITAPDNNTNFYGSGGIIQLVDATTGKEYADATVTVNNGDPSTLIIEQSAAMASDVVQSIDVVLKRRRAITSERRKTLTAATPEIQSTGTGTTITLNQCDIWGLTTLEVSEAGVGAYSPVSISHPVKLHYGTSDVAYDFGTVSGLLPDKDYRVSYQYWEHSSGDYFTINSYMIGTNVSLVPDLYTEIPLFISDDNKQKICQRNVFDFRRKVTDISSSGVPLPESFIAMDYQHYISRIDSVYIGLDGEFRVSQGIPAVNPDAPLTTANSMRMWNITVLPYTLSLESVFVDIIPQLRYTMRDIGGLENRITNLEYYSAVSELSQSAQAITITDSQGNSKFKNGIFVDNFAGLINANTFDPEFRAAIDPAEGNLRSSFTMTSVDVENTQSDTALATAGLSRNNSTYTLAYTQTPFISTDAASGALNVNPYAIFSWIGAIGLTPASDNWVDTSFLPDVHVDGTGEARSRLNVLNSGAEPIWGTWEDNIIGVDSNTVTQSRKLAALSNGYEHEQTRDVTITATTTQSDRTGSMPVYELSTTSVVDERLVSSSSIYYMRPVSIAYSAEGMYPNINLDAFFNGVNESSNCTSLVTDDAGRCSGVFTVPAETYRTGKTLFQLVDADVPLEPRTEGEAAFVSSGTLNTRQNTITSVGSITTVITKVSETKTSTTTTDDTTSWIDPLAQSFLIQEDGGCYISSIEIFFNTKDDVIPVELAIVENKNGYPSQNVLPFSSKFLYPADITVSADGQAGTVFTFDDPVFVNPETEYSFRLISNSNNYRVFYGEIGSIDLVTSDVIDKQPYAGVLFKSQNASTWTADQTKDMKFTINKCVFDTNVTRSLDYTPDVSSFTVGDENLTLMNPNFEVLVLPDTVINLKYQFSSVETPLYVVNKSDNILKSQQTIKSDGTSEFKMTAEFTSGNPNLTPVISSERTSIIAVNNMTADLLDGTYDAGKYISANVKLSTMSDDIRVIFAAWTPGGSSVQPYYRTTKYVPKYVTIQDSLTPINVDQVNTELSVYWRQPDATLTAKGVVSVVQVKNNTAIDTDRYVLSGVEDYSNFLDADDFTTEPLIGVDGHIIITSEADITSMPEWVSGISYTQGDIVIVGNTLWRCLLTNSSLTSPQSTDLNWLLLDMAAYSISVVTEDDVAEWRPMRPTTTTSSEIIVGNTFIEYEYEPAEYVDEDFDTFSVKLELISTDNVNIPYVRNLRAIAVM